MGKIPKKSHGDGSPQRFSDEVAGQLYSNNTRFWSFQEHLPRKVNTTRSSQSFFGWYAMQGKSLLTELKGGKVADIQQALLAIKEANNEYDCMVIFWDNAKTHKALETWGWERQIYFIPIPSYSPNLNPLERLWKPLKKSVNETQFVKGLNDLTRLYQQGFSMLQSKLSFMDSWWEHFKVSLSWYSTIFDSNTIP